MSTIMEKIKKFLGIKEKVAQEPGVIGFYDSKPFHNFKYALIYANETLISKSDDEKTENVIEITAYTIYTIRATVRYLSTVRILVAICANKTVAKEITVR